MSNPIGFASPQKADSKKLLAEQEKEVVVKRLSDGTEMVVPNRLAQELLLRKPKEFDLVGPMVPSAPVAETPVVPVEPVVTAPTKTKSA